MKKLSLLLLLILMAGCATNPETKKLADTILCPACSNVFNDPVYQWDSKRAFRGFLVMAYGKDKAGACSCATAYHRELETKWIFNEIEVADVNNLAIARCNENGKSVNLNATCEIFAIGDEIVWKKNPETGEDDIDLQ